MQLRRMRVVIACSVALATLVIGISDATAAIKKPQLGLSHSATQHIVRGQNFPANSKVSVTLKGQKSYSTTATATRTGSFVATFPRVTSPTAIIASAGKVHVSVAVQSGEGSSAAPAAASSGSHLALVYRGPAGCDGCSEAVAALLKKSPYGFTVKYVGPNDAAVTPALLHTATLYAQPGGGDDLDQAWQSVSPTAPAIRDFVKNGGHYLGFCMGGYLAGKSPGYNLLPGDAGEYVGSKGSTVKTTNDTLVQVTWRGKQRTMYFQDGNYVQLDSGAKGTVLAKFPNNLVAASVTPYGAGKVAVSGPHPEADQSWYSEAGLRDPDGVDTDLGLDLINTLMH